ncbi:DUF423 domain-containing protein [Roseofilum reptotaenium CS-1145]|uniref:DUF423 domain-containing protein n=1 Tax=Roseofilum reptotaenium AO1-A TaxID=1925591 RepID=A0A1L9QUF8_9CYAN|nr:DUF423 domain-containing protein [Roseofilum reptotaenium]MDB9517731.1 DUF423 domain-containing protein [Roseofilum reptotaenium CS-1145]OJJ26320.1 hypothetical protein BI308_06825 [Roseofilum reptotaenium AO1-A]
MSQVFLTLGSLFAAIAVAAGAFASHALKDQLSDRSLEIFETATKYQMYHALGIILVALLLNSMHVGNTWMVTAGWAFVAGILLFSGSLYALSVTGIKILGAITPFGGVAFLIGWGCLALSTWLKTAG